MKNVKSGHKQPIVCLNAGHYGKVNRSPVVKTYYESEMVWKLHNFLADELEKYGIEVRKTRKKQTDQMSLLDRGKAAKGCDLWLSIHSNAFSDESVDRPVVFYMVADNRTKIDEQSKEIGTLLGQTIYEVMQTKGKAQITYKRANTDIDGDGVLNDEWYGELRGAHMVGTAGLILEHSFHTNKRAAEWLSKDSNLKKLAKAEAKTVAEWFGMDKKAEDKAEADKKAEDSPAKKETVYRVQVGAFRNKAYAEALCDELKENGYNAVVVGG